MGRGFNRLIPRLTRLKFTLTGPRTDNTSTVLASVKDRGFPDSAPSQDLGSLSGLEIGWLLSSRRNAGDMEFFVNEREFTRQPQYMARSFQKQFCVLLRLGGSRRAD